MATIAYDSLEGPGKGRRSPAFSKGGRVEILSGLFTFDSSYPTGGESIAEIFDLFNDSSGTSQLKGMIMESPMTSAGTGKRVRIDYTNKKAMLYDNAVATAEVVNATDQSGAANLRWVAWGTS